MPGVDDPQGHQDPSGAQPDRFTHLVLDESLFKQDFTAAAGGHERVFNLQFRLKHQPLVVLIAHIKDQPVKIELIAARSFLVVPVHVTVATNR